MEVISCFNAAAAYYNLNEAVAYSFIHLRLIE